MSKRSHDIILAMKPSVEVFFFLNAVKSLFQAVYKMYTLILFWTHASNTLLYIYIYIYILISENNIVLYLKWYKLYCEIYTWGQIEQDYGALIQSI